MTGREEVIETIRLWLDAARKTETGQDHYGSGYRNALWDLEDLLGTL